MLFGVCQGGCPASMGPSCPTYCRACDGATQVPVVTPGSSSGLASFQPQSQGLYTLELGYQSPCGWNYKQLSVIADCTDVVPSADIITPNPCVSNRPSEVTGQQMTLVGDATLPLGNTNTMTYCWCILAAPTGSTAAIQGSLNSKTVQFTPDLEGSYTIRFTAMNGCQKNASYVTFTADCGCAPVASAGIAATAEYTGRMPAATSLIALSGSYSYDPENRPIRYKWELTSWSGSAGWVMRSSNVSTANSNFNSVYTFGVATTGSGMVGPKTNLITFPNTTTLTNSSVRTFGVNGLLVRDDGVYNPKKHESTAEFVERSSVTTIVTTTTRYTQTNSTGSSFSQCTVTIYNSTQEYAWFKAEPFDRCQGVFSVRLTVDDTCKSSSDNVDVEVRCSQPHDVELQCIPEAPFNYTTKTFPSIQIDGRSTNVTDQNYSWSVTPGAGTLTPSTTDLTATFVPTARSATIWLNLTDGCTWSKGSVMVSTQCTHNVPTPLVTQVIPSPQDKSWNRGGFVQPLEYQVTLDMSAQKAYNGKASYVTATWMLKDNANGRVLETGASSVVPFNLTRQVGVTADYSLYVTVTDGCETSPTVNTPPYQLNCQGGNPAIRVPTQTCAYDKALDKFLVQFIAEVNPSNPFIAGRGLNWTWTINASSPAFPAGSVTDAALLLPAMNLSFASPANSFIPTYQYQNLQVNAFDGCTTAAATVSVTCTCPARNPSQPWSSASNGQASAASQTINQITTWNGTQWTASFPNITLVLPQVQTGFNQTGDTYTWTVTNADGSATRQGQLGSAFVGFSGDYVNMCSLPNGACSPLTFQPDAPGTYLIIFTMKDKCQLLAQYTFRVTAQCNPYSSPDQYVQYATSSMSVSTVAAVNPIQWNTVASGVSVDNDNGKYNTICLRLDSDAWRASLTTPPQNHPKTTYTWEMVSSPAGSGWGMTGVQPTVTLPSPPNVITSSVTTPGLTTSTTTQTIETYTRTMTVTETAILSNHGYSGVTLGRSDVAQTCFTPDITGQYSVRLKFTDGCASGQSSTWTFTAKPCTIAPRQVVIWSKTGGSNPAKPMTGDRLFISLSDVTGITDFRWNVTEAPCGSAQANVTQESLMNAQGAVTSFSPQIGGFYTISFVVSNGCATTMGTKRFEVFCTGVQGQNCPKPALTSLPVATAVNPVNFTSRGTGNTFNSVALNALSILNTAGADDCKASFFSWNVIEQSCTYRLPPVIVPPPAPVPIGVCNTSLTNGWWLWSAPCGSSYFAQINNAANRMVLVGSTPLLNFTADKGGAYQFTFTTTDGCTSAAKNVTLQLDCPLKTMPKVVADYDTMFPYGTGVGAVCSTFAPVIVKPTGEIINDIKVNVSEATCPVNNPTPAAVPCGKKLCVCSNQRCAALEDKCVCPQCVCSDGTIPTDKTNPPAGTPNPGTPPQGTEHHDKTVPAGAANGISNEEYLRMLQDAEDAYNKYLLAIWAGAMVPLGTALVVSAGANVVTIVKFKPLLFGQGMGSGGVEMSEAPALPRV